MVNYYNILEVHQEVSTEEIKRSFRTLIKKYHPDIHGPNKLWAESKTKIIIQAYKTLSDTTAREQYDRKYRNIIQTSEKPRPTKKAGDTKSADDIQTRVRIVFVDLLNGHIHNAIENYENLLKDCVDIDLFLHLNRRDSIDCKFLLAEAYEKLERYDVAIDLYEFILEKGKGASHRRHLHHEIKERIRNIYCRNLARYATPEKALVYYEKVLKLDLYKNETAFVHKKIAECYLELENYEKALHHLNIALSLKPNLQGSNKLKAKLKQHMPNFAI